MTKKPGSLLAVITRPGRGTIIHAKGAGTGVFLEGEWEGDITEYLDLLEPIPKTPGVYRVSYLYENDLRTGGWPDQKTEQVKWKKVAASDKKALTVRVTDAEDLRDQ